MLKYSIIAVLLVALSLGTMGCGEDLVGGAAKETEKFSSWVATKMQARKQKSDAELAARNAKWMMLYQNRTQMLADVEGEDK